MFIDSLVIEMHQNLIHFNSGLLTSENLLPFAGSFVCYFLFVFSVLYTKMHFKVNSLADIFRHLTVFVISK